MGIGNHVLRRQTRQVLGPHYPSWGLETSGCTRRSGALTGPHYPSWGLETNGRYVTSRLQSRAHYPSWGLETPARARPSGPESPAHYPSWGLETSGRQYRPVGRDGLITPHGDWKPRCGEGVPTPGAGSLPLMGIGNKEGGSRSCVCDCSSLPLMGIGNARRATTGRCSASFSLPLMGIGNLSASSPPGAPDTGSLPLMGIGNVGHVVADRSDGALITPHGDWKPFPFIDLCHQPLRRRPHRGVSDHRICAGPSILAGSYSQARVGPLTQQTNPGHAIGPSLAAWAHRRGHCSAE